MKLFAAPKERTQTEIALLGIALPEMFGSMGLMLFDLGHLFWASRLGASAIAGLGSASALEWMLFSLMGVAHLGCRALIPRHRAAKHPHLAIELGEHAFWFTAVLGVAVAGVLLLICPFLFRGMGLSAPASAEAISYFRIWLLASPISYLFLWSGSLFIGHADTRTSNLVLTGCLIFTLILDPFLMFGWLGLPKLGIQGAALASAIAYTAGLAVRVFILVQRGYLKRFPRVPGRDSRHLKDLMTIGRPLAATNLAWSAVYPLLTPIVARFGTPAIAAVNIGHGIENVAYYIGAGLAAGSTVLAGRAHGEKSSRQVREVIQTSLKLANRFALPISLAFIVFPGLLFGLVTRDPRVIYIGVPYLRIIGYFEVFMLWEQVLQGVLCGVGKSSAAFWICFPLTFARIPLAYFLANLCGFGDVGIWWAISLTTLAKGLLLFHYLRHTYATPAPSRAKTRAKWIPAG